MANFNLPDTAVTAIEMADALNTVATKLLNWHLIGSDGFSVLQKESLAIKKSGENLSWRLMIDRDTPVTFVQAKDKNGNAVIPRLVCKEIHVEQTQHECPPFQALDIAIEIESVEREPIARWHVDLANHDDEGPQAGPLTHLQYGGHNAGSRHLDHPLKVPRWCHPPMEVILLCDVIAANFHTEIWEDGLSEDRAWCEAVAVAQRLCYSAYLRKMARGLSISSKTLLHSMWASKWSSAT